MEDSIIALVQQISDECTARKVDATPALIAYTVRSIISSRIEDFQIDVTKPLTPDKQTLLHDEAMNLLQNQSSLPMLTIRMQVDMDLGLAQVERSTKQREEHEAEHRQAIEQELVTMRARSSTALESLYRKIVSYSIIASKWGSPNDPQIVRQATACLEQVFPPTELPKFLSQSDDDKKKVLQDVSKLVLGARVFQTFGSDLADPTTNLRLEVPKKLDQMKARLTTSIDSLNSIIIEYTNALKDPPSDKPEDRETHQRMTEELANRQQFLFFYELLMNKLKDISKSVEQGGVEFDNLMKNLHGLMEVSETAPISKAAPNFTALSNVWSTFRINEEGMKNVESLLARLRKHKDTFNFTIREGTDSAQISTSAVVAEAPQQKEAIPKESEVMVGDSSPVVVQRENDGEVAFNGFCPVTLVERQGLLLPGDVVLGSVKWERRYYAFVDKEKREKFLKDPAKWHNAALEVARLRPELISLLGLQNEFPNLHAPKIPVRASVPKPRDSKYRDAEVETVTHPVESFIDRTYHWNQWELMKRKKILKGLENKRSKTAQTDISHFRREGEAQTTEKRDKNEQTMVDSGVEMPRTVRYIAGLRGDSQAQAKVVTMTFDLKK